MALTRRFLQTIEDRCPPPPQGPVVGLHCPLLEIAFLCVLAASCGHLHLLVLARSFCPKRDQL